MNFSDPIIGSFYAALLLIVSSEVYCYHRNILPNNRLYFSTIRNSNIRNYHQAEILIGSRTGIIPFLPDFHTKDGANRINISDNISFQSDFITCTGKDVYFESVVRGSNSFLLPFLSEVSINISSKVTSQNYLSSSGIAVLSVRWNVSFIPETVSFFNFIGKSVPGLRVSYFNLIGKEMERSTFSWKSLYLFLQRIFFTGVVRIPIAVILGTSEFTFVENWEDEDNNVLNTAAMSNSPISRTDESKMIDIKSSSTPTSSSSGGSSSSSSSRSDNVAVFSANSMQEDNIEAVPSTIFGTTIKRSRIVSRELVKHSERISLVSAVNSNRLLNRRMVRDLMEYLDAVRPPSLGINEWDDIIVRNLKLRNVPGMGQFDIDGLDPERQAQLVGTSNRILGAFTAALLVAAAGSFAVVMDKVFVQQEKLQLQKQFIDTLKMESDYKDN